MIPQSERIIQTASIQDQIEGLLALLPPPVLLRYQHKNPDLSPEAVLDHYRELIRYLLAASQCREDLTPSAVVDDAWHNFILFTKLYEPWCKEHFGIFIHHVPTVGEATDGEMATYVITVELLTKQVGAKPELWPLEKVDSAQCAARCKPGKCGKCGWHCYSAGI